MWGKFISEQIPEIHLENDDINIGKLTTESLRNNSKISGIHFQLIRTDFGKDAFVEIADRSTNGTYLNGKRLQKGKPTHIACFDQITLLNTKLQPDAVTLTYYDMRIVEEINKECDLLKKYRIGRYIGEGAYGVVREVTEIETNKKYALKMLINRKINQILIFHELFENVIQWKKFIMKMQYYLKKDMILQIISLSLWN